MKVMVMYNSKKGLIVVRLIRFELLDKGIFQYRSYDLTDEEENELYELRARLHCPNLGYNHQFRFFFTLEGFHRHKEMIRYMTMKYKRTGFVQVKRAWKNEEKIGYEDDEQVAIVLS